MQQEGFLSSKVLIILFLIFLIFVLLHKATQLYNLKQMVNRFQEDKEVTPFVESIKQKIQIFDSSSHGDNVAARCFRSGRENYNIQLNQMCKKQGKEEKCNLWSLNLKSVQALNKELDKTMTNCTQLVITPLSPTH